MKTIVLEYFKIIITEVIYYGMGKICRAKE
jgi:hypothetical protein